jgi:uncharacterized membrane protein (UPF0127 family)
MMKKVIFFLLMLLSIISYAAHSQKKFVKVFFPNGFSLTAELAVTDEERQLGLMFRDEINWDQGMLFVFEEEGIRSFWMKNMRISLDFLWLNKEKRIIHIETHVPPCKKEPCPSYSPRVPAMYVLELKAGSVEKNQLKLYDKIEFILPKLK